MRLRTNVIGALNLFSYHSQPLGLEDQQVAQALADVATIGILQERAERRIGGNDPTSRPWSIASCDRTTNGILAEHNHVSVDDAFKALRGYARSHNRLLGQIAGEIIDGTLTSEALTAATRSQPA